ncbi:MAG: cytochrome c oxidase subunit 3 [Planctomycetota bacterium]|jgi:cytochrome c oxidase subunit 3
MAARGDGLRSLWQGKSPFAGREASFLAGRLGMLLFLTSLAMLFAASVIGYAVVRHERGPGPVELPPLPRLLWLSTILLLLGSATIQSAVKCTREGRPASSRRALLATTILCLGFLAVQAACWWQWLETVGDEWARSEPYRIALSGFYVFTGIHALHVLGVLVGLGFVIGRAIRGRDTAAHHPGVLFIAWYWHFLDVVWIILFATLLIAT